MECSGRVAALTLLLPREITSLGLSHCTRNPKILVAKQLMFMGISRLECQPEACVSYLLGVLVAHFIDGKLWLRNEVNSEGYKLGTPRARTLTSGSPVLGRRRRVQASRCAPAEAPLRTQEGQGGQPAKQMPAGG